MKCKNSIKSLCLIYLMIFHNSPTSAHGGVEVIGNQCILSAGPFQMLFTGYQPKISNEAFCDDIPFEGDTIIVLDFVDKILRGMRVDYRVIKDAKGLALTANINNIGSAEDIQKSTVFYLPPQTYPRGTFFIERNFNVGKYIGIVTLKDEQTNVTNYSVFPFSVGVSGPPWNLMLIIGILLILATGLVFSIKKSALTRK